MSSHARGCTRALESRYEILVQRLRFQSIGYSSGWCAPYTAGSNPLIVFARSDDDYFFGILQSRLHEVWAIQLGTRLETYGLRYTPTTCFETFPFPEPTDAQRAAIAAAAKELDTLRNNWLNPPEWTRTEVLEFPGSTDGPWRRYIESVPLPLSAGRG